MKPSDDMDPTVGEEAELDADTQADTDEGPLEGVERELEPGTQAGRYLILSRLGRGGMGVVYKAYDPELDRRIALKVMRVTEGDASRANRARERLLREAKALAQLSHPNVVSAYDVGTFGKDVFVAMELLEGGTLKQWMAEKRPSVYQRVEILTAAGRGIAAAHKVGLIHRDIKPDNIIVAQDGRARVLDFGLARTGASAEQEHRSDAETSAVLAPPLLSDASYLSTPITMAGAVVGTPGYMAPEQYLGEEVCEKSDQYSFCVTLYEVLYGHRPFRAKRYPELKHKVFAGKFEPEPNPSAPSHFRRIALRGLSVDKVNRFSSMEDLLQELEKDPRSLRRKALAIAAVILLIISSFIGAFAWQAKRQKLCQGAQDKLAGVWDQQQKQHIQQKFMASGRSYAKDTFDRVSKVMDQYAKAWVLMRTEACEATHLRGEQSEQLLDLRMACLDRRWGEAHALTQLFASSSDAEILEKAVQAAYGLPSINSCADTAYLTAIVPPPRDPALRAKVEKTRAQLDQARALGEAGKVKEGLRLAKTADTESDLLGYHPLQAEAKFLHGALQSHSGDAQAAEASLKAAIRHAAHGHDLTLRAKAIAELIYVVGYQQARFAEALEIGQLAEADVIAAGNAPLLQAKVAKAIGVVLGNQGRYPEARKHLEQARAWTEKELGSHHPALALVLNNIGLVDFRQGKFKQAQQTIERTLTIYQKALGPDHPALAFSMNNLFVMMAAQGNYVGAQKWVEKALAVWEAAYGPDHPQVANALNNLGSSLTNQGQYAEALLHFQRALAIYQKAVGLEHPHTAYTLHGLGTLYQEQGQYAQAQSYFARALAIRQKSLPADHPLVKETQTDLDQCLVQLKKGQKN